jgi:uncharacterized protein (TIGR03437 family)
MTARHAREILAVAGIGFLSPFLHAQTMLQIVTESLPNVTVGTPYNQPLATSGGNCSATGTASSTIDDGALPPGISVLSGASVKQWSLQGIPSTAGTFHFTVHVRWTQTRTSPFQQPCVDEATKALTLTVDASQTLTADRTQVTTLYHTGTFPPPNDTVKVSSAGAPVTIAAQAATDSGGPWLSVTAQPATTPASLSIGYSIGGLAPGTYMGRINVTSGSGPPLIIPVTLAVVVDTNVQLQVNPPSLSFSSVTGGPDPAAQSIAVTVPGLSRLFQASVSAAPPNGKWLTVSPTAAATPQTLRVAVTAKDLAVGVYNGGLKLAIDGIPDASVNIPVTYTIQAPVQKPTIFPGGVVDAAGGGKAIAPGSWVSIFGTQLSGTTRAWLDADFQAGRLPTALDGVSVTINGKSAPIAFVSPGQINVLAPDDGATGLGPVQVKNAQGASDSALVLQQTAAPALFQFQGTTYAASTHVDGSYVAGPRLVAQGIPGTASKVGETIVLFGTGFGVTQPAISATALVPAPLPLARPEDLRVRIGGLDAAVAYAGLISPGVYQFNVVVPQVAEGDQAVVVELRGLLTQSNLLVAVQR